MLEDVILLAFCSLVALAGLAVCLWEVASGRLFSMDGLTLTLISLTLALVFGGNVGWSVLNGDARRLLSHFRKPPQESEATKENP